jgi:N-acetyltransferase 10
MEISLISKLFSWAAVSNHRSILLLKGPGSNAKIPFIHYLWKKNSIQTSNSILWCFKDQKFKKNFYRNGTNLFEGNDNFEITKGFMKSRQIRFCYYKETKKLLGNSFGMCILQDFESITPNSLARIIDTIEGGGTIIFLLETLNSLKNLHHLSLEIYNNFRNQTVKTITSRFLDRFFLSLKNCDLFLSINNKLEVCPEFKKNGFLKIKERNLPFQKDNSNLLIELIKNLNQMEPLASLISKTKTFDQARAFLSFSEAIADKKKFSTILLTSGRGRGKSATLGLAVSSGVAFGYGNIYVTAPDPENLHSFFAFFLIGLKVLGYKESQDFEIIQNSKFKCIDRILIYTSHHQVIKFIFPSEIQNFKESIELLVIDEAAGIDLSFLEKVVGNYSIFIASTIFGYEGTGKALNLKLIKKFKMNQEKFSPEVGRSKTRIFKEIYLEEPIRFSKNDPVEKWLNELLCMNMEQKSFLSKSCPVPKNCHLFLVDRNALFSSHKIANLFLQNLMGLFSSSHYKNSPDDLQMLCDAPSHRIFILLAPFILSIGLMPDILVALHISYEGQINIKFARKCLYKGLKMNGDLIPWAISREFLDPTFAELAGVRILRIVTNPDYQKIGYGTRALELFSRFLEKKKKKKI